MFILLNSLFRDYPFFQVLYLVLNIFLKQININISLNML